jgi:hypothetical protein
MPITNGALAGHQFLGPMYADGYYPNELVDKVRAVLFELCEQVEASPSLSLVRLYALSHAATERINEIAPEFEEHDSELETVAREAIAAEFSKIAECYGFAEADLEELISPRDW